MRGDLIILRNNEWINNNKVSVGLIFELNRCKALNVKLIAPHFYCYENSEYLLKENFMIVIVE